MWYLRMVCLPMDKLVPVAAGGAVCNLSATEPGTTTPVPLKPPATPACTLMIAFKTNRMTICMHFLGNLL
jgi:hypothetical protein